MPIGWRGQTDYDGPFYAGIGSRSTPVAILRVMQEVAGILRMDYVLRSGHAEGADRAFETGAQGRAQIFLPWPTFNDEYKFAVGAQVSMSIPKTAYDIAGEFHPKWRTLTAPQKKLHARNAQQIFGPTCDPDSEPVEFVVCWDDPKNRFGGTKTAIHIAEAYGIPVTNLWYPDQLAETEYWLKEAKKI